ncbi:MAG: HAD family hydrolase [Oscillatoriaceae cyanobacterium]
MVLLIPTVEQMLKNIDLGEITPDNQPKVIFFDAVGTLFGVRGGVGEVYAEQAKQFGVDIEPELLEKCFIDSFRAAPEAAFPHATPDQLARLEFDWWEAIARQTFHQANVLHHFPHWGDFFTQLYHHFATAAPWDLYPDVYPQLQRLQSLHIQLGVLSNFDSRLYSVLKALKLDHFFSSVTISTAVGAAKPDPHIFTVALAKHQCPPHQAWHVGDSHKEDYLGAAAAGLRPILVQR